MLMLPFFVKRKKWHWPHIGFSLSTWHWKSELVEKKNYFKINVGEMETKSVSHRYNNKKNNLLNAVKINHKLVFLMKYVYWSLTRSNVNNTWTWNEITQLILDKNHTLVRSYLFSTLAACFRYTSSCSDAGRILHYKLCQD